ncbi:hypothetical protein [Marininema halotolerans]|uniref:Uncharacterized protein n=1 Tax=Marininema halotolerans TaxID=1155944 RepID=A0A1I6R9K3_9BACL|nr:hypothetical protein [Marininema halotolerans]SFS61382.1 hypothetical protein SAMN05444972_104307 [Marininema halotolerans]
MSYHVPYPVENSFPHQPFPQSQAPQNISSPSAPSIKTYDPAFDGFDGNVEILSESQAHTNWYVWGAYWNTPFWGGPFRPFAPFGPFGPYQRWW